MVLEGLEFIFFKILFIYSFMRNTERREKEREAETQEEGEAGSMKVA